MRKFILITGILALLLIAPQWCQKRENRIPYSEPQTVLTTDVDTIKLPPLTKENVYKQIVGDGLVCPDIVMKQAIVESGWFKSNLSKTHNNIFGFKGKNGWMKFDHWTDCVSYYKIWQLKRYKGGDYYHFLEKINYAEDTSYIRLLKRVRYGGSKKLSGVSSDSL